MDSYNFNYAITLRELTWLDFAGNEIYYSLSPPEAVKKINFLDSVKIAKDFKEQEVFAPDIPMVHEVLMNYMVKHGTSFRGVTKKQWLEEYRSWREYMHQSSAPELDICPNA